MKGTISCILLVLFSATLAKGFTGRFDHRRQPTAPDDDLKFHKDLRVHRKAHIKTQQALRNSCELLRRRKELYASSCNCMQAYITVCKLK